MAKSIQAIFIVRTHQSGALRDVIAKRRVNFDLARVVGILLIVYPDTVIIIADKNLTPREVAARLAHRRRSRFAAERIPKTNNHPPISFAS